MESFPALKECMVLRRDDVDVVDVSVPIEADFEESIKVSNLPKRTAVSFDLVKIKMPRGVSVSWPEFVANSFS
jgi:hypothetical protein